MDHQDPRSALGRYLGPLCANNGRSISLIANSGQLTGAQTRGLPSETALLAPTQAQKFGPDAAPAPDSKASMSDHQSQLGRWQVEPLRDERVINHVGATANPVDLEFDCGRRFGIDQAHAPALNDRFGSKG